MSERPSRRRMDFSTPARPSIVVLVLLFET
jgi:hypothetical protein